MFFIFAVLLALLMGREANAEDNPKAEASAPSSLVEFQWSDDLHGFEGVQYLFFSSNQLSALSGSHGLVAPTEMDLDFWLLPNRDLKDSKEPKLNREQIEFSKTPPSIEWPHAEIGLGAVTVRQVDLSEAGHHCLSSSAWKISQNSEPRWRTQSFERRDFERHLRVNLSLREKSSCYVVRILFQFFPRDGLGNFALQSGIGGVFSGPIHLLLQSTPLPTTLRFLDRNKRVRMSCLGCVQREEDWTEVEFYGLPPVLNFSFDGKEANALMFSIPSPVTQLSSPIGEKERKYVQAVEELIELFKPSVDRVFAQTGVAWGFKLSPDVLIERLVSGQKGEIQLGPAYGEFGLFLDSYQRAALFREVARDFLRHSFQLASVGIAQSWSKLEEDERWVRLITEIWVAEFFPDILKLEKLSSKFSFLPFFKDVQSGKAFMNNDIFMGKEEQGNSPDFNLYEEFFSPMTGAELVSRLRSCAASEDFEEIKLAAVAIAHGHASIAEFQNYVATRQPKQDCIARMERGVFPQDVVSEAIRVDKKDEEITVTRQVENIPPSKQFLLYRKIAVVREKLVLDIDEAGVRRKVVLPEPQSEEKLSHSLNVKNSPKVSVVLPVRTYRADRLTWPRPVRTVLQSISMNYDSRQDDLALRSEVLFYQVGDDWERNSSIGFRRIFSQNYVNLQFSSRIPSLFDDFKSTISMQSDIELKKEYPTFLSMMLDTSAFQAGLLYPEGIGFQGWLRRPLSLSALSKRMTDPDKEFIFEYSLGLAPRFTWKETLTYGASDLGVDIGLRDLPAWPAEEFISQEYGLIRSEIFHTLAHNLVVPLMRTIIFQHAVIYASHVLAFDTLEPVQGAKVGGRAAHSISAGIRLYGALLGAKNQSLSFEVARSFSSIPKTSYSFSVGRSIN